jgi:hypothetical protein
MLLKSVALRLQLEYLPLKLRHLPLQQLLLPSDDLELARPLREVRDLVLRPDKLRAELDELLLQRNGRFGRLFKSRSQLGDFGVRGRRRIREERRVLLLCRG